jgi:hypothetical protein
LNSIDAGDKKQAGNERSGRGVDRGKIPPRCSIGRKPVFAKPEISLANVDDAAAVCLDQLAAVIQSWRSGIDTVGRGLRCGESGADCEGRGESQNARKCSPIYRQSNHDIQLVSH